MAAYILVDCKVTDPARYEGYKKLAEAAIAQHGGRYLVRGGESALLEGHAAAQPHRRPGISYARSREGVLRLGGVPRRARCAGRRGGYDDGRRRRRLAGWASRRRRSTAPRWARMPWSRRGRCTGGFDRTGRETHARDRRPCRRTPFAAPVVVAHQRPDAFDHVGFLGARGAQMRRVASALPPHDRGSPFIRFAHCADHSTGS